MELLRMHDCRKTRTLFTELLLDEPDRRPDEVLSADLRGCSECRAEFDALNATLRFTGRMRETAPDETYWSGYHERLRHKLTNAHTPTSQPSWLLRIVKSSVRVPVPVAAAIIVACALLIPMAIRGGRRQIVERPDPVVVRVPVQEPLIQEKTITRVVYRERRPLARNPTRNKDRVQDAFDRSQKPLNEVPVTLSGFKPSEEIKLTVIKGGSPNEK
jgi:hypothetical protein